MGGLIWLASYPKSGNTWLRAFLHNLLTNPDRPADINTLDQFCLGDSQVSWYEHVGGAPAGDLSPAQVAALRPRVHDEFTRAHPDSVFVKTHSFLGETDGTATISMAHTVGAIYVVRNPLDVVSSLSHHSGMDIDATIAFMADPNASTLSDGINVFEPYSSWSHHVNSWAGEANPGLHVVRYEDMLERPRPTFAGIARFLGLDPPRQRLDKAIRFCSFKVLRGQEERAGFRERSVHAERFFRTGKAGTWKSALSAAQIDAVVGAHRAVMERFGYLP